jgi:putative transcriptional regulator
MKSAFDKIAAGLEDAIAYAGGDASRGREAMVDVKAIREANKMTQAAFAEAFRLKLGAVRDWEQGRRRPDTGSVTLLKMVAADPGAVRRIIAKL